MASSSVAGFTSLGQHGYIRRPASASPPSTDPSVILIFGWMGAELSHLHKYTATYSVLYPTTTIILVRSPLSSFWSSSSGLKARYAPVIAALEALGCLDDRQRILTHSFSNGGATHLIALAEMFSPKPTQTNIKSPSALIIDSAPGGATLGKAMRAVTSPIRNTLVKFLASGAFVLVYALLWIVGHILRNPNPILAMMAALRNPRVLPWIDQRTPRLYIYSKVDKMVPAADIEGHAAQCASEGLDVRKLRFEKSAHVAHARDYPEEYWAAVRNLWADASKGTR